MKMTQLASSFIDNRLVTLNYLEKANLACLLLSSSAEIEDYQKQIEQLQKNLSQKDEEQILLGERLNEVELEFKKISDDHASTMARYESLVQERDALTKQQVLESADR